MNKNQQCMICQVTAENGIKILEAFLCEDCEHEIVQTEVEDSRYVLFVSRLRHLNLHHYLS